MKYCEASFLIDANPEAIWTVLADVLGYPSRDLGIVRVEGRIALGEKIKVASAIKFGRVLLVAVSTFEPGRRMVWTGGIALGFFRGVRTFALTPNDANSTTFTMREEFRGPFAPLIGRSILDLGPSFAQFANGLKRRVEQGI